MEAPPIAVHHQSGEPGTSHTCQFIGADLATEYFRRVPADIRSVLPP